MANHYWTLGIHGGISTERHFYGDTSPAFQDEASAVLCQDGVVIAAVEEERFNRIKHTNFFPVRSIRYCLETAGIELADVDTITIPTYDADHDYRRIAPYKAYEAGRVVRFGFREFCADVLETEFGAFDRSRIRCLEHHLAHAYSAFSVSGMTRALTVCLDGAGDGIYGAAFACDQDSIETIDTMDHFSYGFFYNWITKWLGYHYHDEYKVMGLAPYGDPGRYADPLGRLWDRMLAGPPDRPFGVTMWRALESDPELASARRLPRTPVEDRHRDLAAALQKLLEQRLVEYLSKLKRETFDCPNLCLAGGVALNCVANGRLMDTGLFERVFVQPVASDAGIALGAALHGWCEHNRTSSCSSMGSLFLGPDIEREGPLAAQLAGWSDIVDIEELADPPEAAAQIIADGGVIAWVQGRSEFGARALGNRSIVADPRPAENRTRINDLVKKREGFRPFAPSVRIEDLHEYFDVPSCVDELPYMVVAVRVKPEYRSVLGATTHVDGSARVQSVSQIHNPAYWRLIEAFERRTGIGVVLNTSFNNNYEPIVQDATDAMNTFLTTNLDALVIGRHLVRRRPDSLRRALSQCIPELAVRYHVGIARTHEGPRAVVTPRDGWLGLPVDPDVQATLCASVLANRPLEASAAAKWERYLPLWERRVFRLRPAA